MTQKTRIWRRTSSEKGISCALSLWIVQCMPAPSSSFDVYLYAVVLHAVLQQRGCDMPCAYSVLVGLKQTNNRKIRKGRRSRIPFYWDPRRKIILVRQPGPPHGRVQWMVRWNVTSGVCMCVYVCVCVFDDNASRAASGTCGRVALSWWCSVWKRTGFHRFPSLGRAPTNHQWFAVSNPLHHWLQKGCFGGRFFVAALFWWWSELARDLPILHIDIRFPLRALCEMAHPPPTL